jgi:hypothetical protein
VTQVFNAVTQEGEAPFIRSGPLHVSEQLV